MCNGRSLLYAVTLKLNMFLFKTQFEWFFRFLFRFAYLIRFRLSQSSWSQHAVGKCRRDIQQHTTQRHAMLKGSERNNHINVLFIINHAWILYFSINKYEFWDFFSKHNKHNYPFFYSCIFLSAGGCCWISFIDFHCDVTETLWKGKLYHHYHPRHYQSVCDGK